MNLVDHLVPLGLLLPEFCLESLTLLVDSLHFCFVDVGDLQNLLHGHCFLGTGGFVVDAHNGSDLLLEVLRLLLVGLHQVSGILAHLVEVGEGLLAHLLLLHVFATVARHFSYLYSKTITGAQSVQKRAKSLTANSELADGLGKKSALKSLFLSQNSFKFIRYYNNVSQRASRSGEGPQKVFRLRII